MIAITVLTIFAGTLGFIAGRIYEFEKMYQQHKKLQTEVQEKLDHVVSELSRKRG